MGSENRTNWNNGRNEDRIDWGEDTDEGIVSWEMDAYEERRIGQGMYREEEGVSGEPQHEKTGSSLSLLAGILIGFVAMLFLGWIFVLGPILAGFIAGVIAGGGAGRGAGAGFAGGILGFIILAILVLEGIFLETSIGGFIEEIASIVGSFVIIGLLIVGLFYGFLCMTGGAIGGLLRK